MILVNSKMEGIVGGGMGCLFCGYKKTAYLVESKRF